MSLAIIEVFKGAGVWLDFGRGGLRSRGTAALCGMIPAVPEGVELPAQEREARVQHD